MFDILHLRYKSNTYEATIYLLKKFLLKNTLNDRVNRWAMEIKDYQIDFNHIEGNNNVLADTLSRLITIDPEVQLNPEFTNYEFGQ